MSPGEDVRAALVACGRAAAARGWVAATSGNFSAVVGRDPLRLAITPSGADKGRLAPGSILVIDGDGRVVEGEGRPSAEAAVHAWLAAQRRAGAVLHTHSTWSTLLSEAHAAEGGLAIEGLEMLKALRGVATHAHREWLPIVPNTQDWNAGVAGLGPALGEGPVHGFLIRGHGLYTWGEDLAEAQRHLEALEFLLEIVGRRTWHS